MKQEEILPSSSPNGITTRTHTDKKVFFFSTGIVKYTTIILLLFDIHNKSCSVLNIQRM